jgi:pimeloyl-ACP methyl ester carboxylesterase
MIVDAKPVELSTGDLTFTGYEMGTGPLVLCLHGFPDTPFTWRHLLPDLAAAGYRGVAITLRGYEPSSLPSEKIDPSDFRVALLAQDIADWIEALGEKRAHLVAHDWGATIAYAASKKNPDSIKSLTALAVPHPARLGALMQSNRKQLKASSYIAFFQLKGLSEAWVRRNSFGFFDRTWAKWSPNWQGQGEDLRELKTAFSKPGVLKAALSYYRAAANTKDLESLALLGGEITVPTLGLYGESDGCILPDVFSEAMMQEDFPNGLRVRQVEEAGHFLHLERPDLVNPLIVDHIRHLDGKS